MLLYHAFLDYLYLDLFMVSFQDVMCACTLFLAHDCILYESFLTLLTLCAHDYAVLTFLRIQICYHCLTPI